MKHLLNNMSEEEKNAIREQHAGGMKVMTENFSKLLNSKLGDAKPLVNEQMDMEDEFEGVEEVSHMSFLLQNADKNTATNLLKKYMAKHSQTVNFVAILRSEGVDLTDINFCECPNLLMVNLRETPNNFEETQGNCAHNMRGGLWDFDMGDEKTDSLVKEAVPGVEPVYDRDVDQNVATIFFKEGQTTLPPKDTNDIINFISDGLRSTIPTLQKFYKSGQKIPPFIDLYVGTSSTGSAMTNRNVASGRMDYLRSICEKAMAKFNIRADVAFKFITQNFEDYKPSNVDANFYDTTTLKPQQKDRNCFIVVKPLETKGLNPDQVGQLQGNLIDASSSIINSFLVDDVDEDTIVANMRKLQTYSDITDLNKALINARKGSLESFLNRELLDDVYEKSLIVNYLNGAAKRSNKGPIAKLGTNGDIAIMI
jgi:hypothetical protein